MTQRLSLTQRVRLSRTGFPTFYRSLPAVLAARPKAQVVIMADDRTVYGGIPGERQKLARMFAGGSPLDANRVHF